MTASLSNDVLGEEAMVAFGRELGAACCRQPGAVIFLQGGLGMGKTTLTRGVLRAFGHQGPVKSPTYTLVEPYEFAEGCVYHFDLYRLGEPEELEYMGIRDYFAGNSLCLVEWAEKARGFLPTADLLVRIEPITAGRAVTVTAQTATGAMIMNRLQA